MRLLLTDIMAGTFQFDLRHFQSAVSRADRSVVQRQFVNQRGVEERYV